MPAPGRATGPRRSPRPAPGRGATWRDRLRRITGLRLGLLIGLALVAVQVLGGSRGFLYQLELKAVDAHLNLRGPEPPDPRVVVLAVDAASVDAYGQWPWDRRILGRLVRRASDLGAAVVALDIIFSEPARGGPEEDAEFARLLRQTPNVVLGYIFVLGEDDPHARRIQAPGADDTNLVRGEINVVQGTGRGFQIHEAARAETNVREIATASEHFGFFTISPDADGVVRFYYSLLQFQGRFYPSLALKALQLFQRGDALELQSYGGGLPRIRVGSREIRNDEEGRVLLNYRGPGRTTFPTISAVDLLQGRVDAAALEGRIVFVGITEIGVGDIRATPFDPATPGVEVHATLADNVLSGRYLRRTFVSDLVDQAILLALCALLGWAPSRVRSPLWGAALAVGILVGFVVVNHLIFTRVTLWQFTVIPVVGGVLSLTASEIHKVFFAEQEARLIRRTFQQVVSPVVVEEMLREPGRVRLGGERRELTVLFSDIRGFTSISERLRPEQVLEVLNEYLTPMTRIIFEQKGTFDKYMGDAIMAIWNAPLPQPDHALLACRAAVFMRDALRELNQRWGQVRRLPEIQIGVGINTGLMSVGYMGSEMIKSYTVIGDNVNLGSRLEGLNKYYQTDITVSEETWRRARSEFAFRELDRVRVAGKRESVTVYQLVDRTDRLGERRAFLDAYSAALERFRARDFRGAAEGFREALAMSPGDFPAQMYQNRAIVYTAKPPDLDWDGVVTLESK